MWPGEREQLAVWADLRLAAGDRFGERVALCLRAEQLRGSDEREALEASLAADPNGDPVALLGPIAAMPGVELDWQLGVLRTLTLVSVRQPARIGDLLDALSELVRRPAARFLDTLHLENQVHDDGRRLEVLERLAEPEALARPRRIMFGLYPARFRMIRSGRAQTLTRRDPAHVFARGHASRIRALDDSGPSWLCRNAVWSLAWTDREPGVRLAAVERLLAEPWSPIHERTLGRALWDTSLRVRQRGLAAVPELPDAAAPLVLSVLAAQTDGYKHLGDLAHRVAQRAGERPVWVRAVAENWGWREPWVATWLASTRDDARREAVAALPRMRALHDHARAALRWQEAATIERAITELSDG